jgi:predicted lipoprotein with Yx(FWY)xxD motif
VSRITTIALAAVASIALSAGLAVASGGKPALQLHSEGKFGKVLVARNGYTVYAFDKDKRNKDVCQSIFACLAAWPVVKPGAVLAGPGIDKSLIGTIRLKSGTKQLTYNGHPLYTYAGDAEPHETTYINYLQFGARWPALNAAGKFVK